MWAGPGSNTSVGTFLFYETPEEAVAGVCEKGDLEGFASVYENHIAIVRRFSCVLLKGKVLRAYATTEEAEDAARQMRSAADKIRDLPYGEKVSLLGLLREDKNSFERMMDLEDESDEDEFYERGVRRLDI